VLDKKKPGKTSYSVLSGEEMFYLANSDSFTFYNKKSPAFVLEVSPSLGQRILRLEFQATTRN
jgi:hypothetical protein